MHVGFALPQYGAAAYHPDEIAALAEKIESFGADSLWVGDRLLAPVQPTVGYMGGSTFPDEFHAISDPFVLLSIAANATKRVQLGTNVLNAPWYPPALLARSLTTLDLLCGGRLILGLGIGWSPDEYAAVDVPMKERGARLDECLDVLEALWTENPAEHHGDHYSIPLTHAELKPAQKPRPRIFLAGFAPSALRRVAHRADGWLPVCRPGLTFDPVASIAAPLSRIREMAKEVGRDPKDIDAVLRVNASFGVTVEQISDALLRAEQEAEIESAFIDLNFLADDVVRTAELAQQILDLARAR